MDASSQPQSSPAPDAPARLGLAGLALLFGAFVALGIGTLYGALGGPFVSDDHLYLVTSPYTSELGLENAAAILDPWGPAKFQTVNYAPLYLLAAALERRAFGEATFGYHVVNVAVHALDSVLLVALLLASRVPLRGALLGGAFFALHPANVEVVAWISQLKTLGAFGFALGALLALRRHPAAAAALFAAGLLTKASAAFALPTAAALLWARRSPVRDWAWLASWVAIAVLVAIPERDAMGHGGSGDFQFDPRLIAAIGARYLVMSASSWGISAFHEPEPPTSWLDPWVVGGMLAAPLLAWRALATLRARREEAAWWVAAAASFAPVCQVFPFFFPVADRYLYMILPGLIGGSLLWLCDVGSRGWAARRPRRFLVVRRLLWSGAAVLLLAFALRSSERAMLWQSEDLLLLDSARNYRSGTSAHYLRAVLATQKGKVARAVAELRAAEAKGLAFARDLAADPRFAPLHDEPEFQAWVREMAGRRIEYGTRRGLATQEWLLSMAQAHYLRKEYPEAIELLERALRSGGRLDEQLLIDLERVRAKARER